MMLIIFVFDPLAIAMVVAANMAFAKLKPKVKASLPEGAEWGVSYPLTDHFDPSDVDELEHWEDEDYVGATLEEQAKHTDWEEEAEKEVIKEEIDPQFTKGLQEAIRHMRRAGVKIPKKY